MNATGGCKKCKSMQTFPNEHINVIVIFWREFYFLDIVKVKRLFLFKFLLLDTIFLDKNV